MVQLTHKQPVMTNSHKAKTYVVELFGMGRQSFVNFIILE